MNKLYLALILLVSALSPIAVQAVPLGEPHVYKQADGRELSLYVIKPAGWVATDHRPAIVLFHGGGWTSGKPDLLVPQAEFFAKCGLVSVLVQYRLLSPKTKTPPDSCIQDARSAMRWVRGHAAELGVRPDRIGAGGGSAGGHLAGFVGLMNGFDDPQDDLAISPKANVLILFNPVINNGPGKWGYERTGERYRLYSPAHNVTALAPPAIVFQGTEDKLISVATAQEFQAEMTRQGVRCETYYFEGQGHGFFNNQPWLDQTLDKARQFLISLGWIELVATSLSPKLLP